MVPDKDKAPPINAMTDFEIESIERAIKLLGEDFRQADYATKTYMGLETHHRWIESSKWYGVCEVPEGMSGFQDPELRQALVTVLNGVRPLLAALKQSKQPSP